jgi:AraC family transcriptional regulator
MIISIPSHAPGGSRQPSYILHERADRFEASGLGALSIKSFYGGTAHYRAGPAHYRLNRHGYLILNQGTAYTITIESEAPVESFCVFFAEGFVEAALREGASSEAQLLDDPGRPAGQPARFVERCYPHDALISPAIEELRAGIGAGLGESEWFDERLHLLAQHLCAVHRRELRAASGLPAARPATRIELYRRLHIARDYVDAQGCEAIGLAEIASAAGLSPNHLLRSFRAAFGRTPYQYVIERRITEARALLKQTDLPITEVCAMVGFSSLGAFSWWFRKRAGLAPSDYRRANR